MSAIRISSDTLIDIEQNFRVSAGPGAGKTYWLTKHIENVLHNSKRLGRSQKIACITYTNTAVETISERLKDTNEQVEVSTIHSFLYRNLVRYYVHLLSHEFEIDAINIKGHEDTVISNYKFLEKLKATSGIQYVSDDATLVKILSKMKWVLDDKGNLILEYDSKIKFGKYPLKKEIPLLYKKMAWSQGVLHHDDVLFFSLTLIRRYPFILKSLRAGFPYFFIDEFQDTSPIQAAILKQIAEADTVLGIIGDVGQAIYGFQGSNPVHFSSGMGMDFEDYIIENNLRSSDKIVTLLNRVRNDIKQNVTQKSVESEIMLLVGEANVCYEIIAKKCKYDELIVLSWRNDTANSLKYNLSAGLRMGNFKQQFEIADTDNFRRKTILRTIEGVELARVGNFRLALKCIEKIFNSLHKDTRTPASIRYLKKLLTDYHQYYDGTILDFRNYLASIADISIKKFLRGKAFEFAGNCTYKQLAINISLEDEKSQFITIHKAKGEEYDSVLLNLVKESDLSFLLEPKLESIEEHRIYYVAISRAKRNLYITVPTLTEENEQKMKDLDFEVERVEV